MSDADKKRSTAESTRASSRKKTRSSALKSPEVLVAPHDPLSDRTRSKFTSFDLSSKNEDAAAWDFDLFVDRARSGLTSQHYLQLLQYAKHPHDHLSDRTRSKASS